MKTIGIEKGTPFTPSDKSRRIMDLAAHEARAWLVCRLETSYFPSAYFDGGQWHVPAAAEVVDGLATNFAAPEGYPTDNRAVAGVWLMFSAACGFVATLLAFRYSNFLVRAIYRVAGIWLGILNFSFVAACFCWLAYLGVRVSGAHVGRPAIADLMFGLAIAFGIGGQDLARRFLEKQVVRGKKQENEDELSPL